MFKWLFKEYTAEVSVLNNDLGTISLHIIGGTLISLTFFTIGMTCLLMAGWDNPFSKVRIRMTKLLGLFLVACALNRVVELLCFWHNYSNIYSIMKVITGLISLGAVLYMPIVISSSLKDATLEQDSIKDLNHNITKVKDDIEYIKDISRKL